MRRRSWCAMRASMASRCVPRRYQSVRLGQRAGRPADGFDTAPALPPRHREMAGVIRTTHAVRLGFRQIKGIARGGYGRARRSARRGLRFGARSLAALGAWRAADRAAGRCRRVPLDRARPARRRCGRSGRWTRKAPRSACRCSSRPAAAPICRRRGRDAPAGDAAGRACGAGLPLPVAVAEGASGLLPARRACEARGHRGTRLWTRLRNGRRGRRWRAWCWCASGRARPRASSS